MLKETSKLKKDYNYILGGVSYRMLALDESGALQTFYGSDHLQKKYKAFNRIEFKEMLIYGLSYTRMVKRNNSVIEYVNHETKSSCFGQVRYFINLGEIINSENILAIVEVLFCPNYNKEINILNVHRSDIVEVVKVTDIVTGCMLISFSQNSEKYVCRFPNLLESD